MSASPWWKGVRGEGWVLVQGVLLALVAFGPRTLAELPPWPGAVAAISGPAGTFLLLAGGAISALAALGLGPNLTPLPHPKEGGTLVETGLYGLVRHPIYFGLIVAAFGWALAVQGWLTLVYALVLFGFFDLKSRREERWLMGRFPAYAAYRRRVRRLIPFVY